MPHDDNSSEVNQSQVAAQNLTAGRDIQIGRIVQTIVNLGLPFKSQHLRFVQFLANSAYLTCLIGGFIRLWQNGADFTTLLMLILSSGLLSLTCLYYAWFWKPELQDKNAPSSEPSDSDELVKRQQTKHRSRQRTRRLAIVGIFAIPLLTWGGFLGWRSLPPPYVLLLIANFDGPNQQNYQVTENILRELRNATEKYADVKVEPLHKTITEQQGSDIARAEGEQKKATIVIWGEYGVTSTNVQISVHFEILRPPTDFPKLEPGARGQARTLAISELNSFNLQTKLLPSEMAYLTFFTTGMVRYAAEDMDGAIERFNAALEQVKDPATVLGQEVVFFYRGISYHHRSNYLKAIADYNQAINLKRDLAEAYNNRGNVYADQGNYIQAIADFNRALNLAPDLAEVYYNRGNAYFTQNNYTQAISDFNRALNLKRDYVEAYNNRGNAYFIQNNYTQAIADYNQALNLKRDYTEAYNNRGLAYAKQGNYTQAIADFKQALNLKPDYAEVYYNRHHRK